MYKLIITVKEEYRIKGGYIGESIVIANKNKALDAYREHKESGLYNIKMLKV